MLRMNLRVIMLHIQIWYFLESVLYYRSLALVYKHEHRGTSIYTYPIKGNTYLFHLRNINKGAIEQITL